MRALFFAILLAAFSPLPALAQTASSDTPSTRPARGGDITRDQYIEHAVERARKSAATRFDRMDTNHDGILTADERRAARASRRGANSDAQ
jgi:hypothetical protein